MMYSIAAMNFDSSCQRKVFRHTTTDCRFEPFKYFRLLISPMSSMGFRITLLDDNSLELCFIVYAIMMSKTGLVGPLLMNY